MTDILRVDPLRPDAQLIARAAACLRAGGLVAFPTETVYGLGVHALDRRAVAGLFAAKERPANDPLIVHVATADRVLDLVAAFPQVARDLAEAFWPGPLTMVLPRRPEVPDEVTAGLDTVAVRVPAHPVARALLEAAAVPIAAPSANRFSRPSPTHARHVLNDLDGRIDMVIDGGPTQVGVESTVVDLTTDIPRVLRPGAVSLELLRTIAPETEAGRAVMICDPATAAPAPGLLSKHYAPRAPLLLFRGTPAAVARALPTAVQEAVAKGQRVGLLATSEDARVAGDLQVTVADLGPADDLARIAQRLYAALRELDAGQVDVILAVDLAADQGLARAIRDRLHRAATRIVSAE